MSDLGTLREGIIQNWLRARDGVIGQVESLTDQQLEWAPGPGAFRAIQIARHLADAGTSYAQYAATGVRPQPGQPPVDPGTRDEVLARLRAGRAEIEAQIRSMAESDLMAPITALQGHQTDRLSFLNFGYAHEMYHWGQLGLCARAAGQVPQLTQAIEARRRKAAGG